MQEFFSGLFIFRPVLLLRHLHELRKPGDDIGIALAGVGDEAVRAVLHAVFRVPEVALALLPQGEQGAVAEQAVEFLRMFRLVAGEELALLVLEAGVGALHGLFVKGFAVGHMIVLLVSCFHLIPSGPGRQGQSSGLLNPSPKTSSLGEIMMRALGSME